MLEHKLHCQGTVLAKTHLLHRHRPHLCRHRRRLHYVVFIVVVFIVVVIVVAIVVVIAITPEQS